MAGVLHRHSCLSFLMEWHCFIGASKRRQSLKELVHQGIAVAGDRYFASAAMKGGSESYMLVLFHLEAVGAAVPARVVHVRRIAIK